MALTTDEITISNLAMGYIGEYAVEAAKTSEKQYILCDRYYDSAVEEVLCEHPWNEAKKRTILMQDTTAPLFGYSYRFAVPSDYLKVLRIGDGDGDLEMWEVENGYILTDRVQSPLAYSTDSTYVAGQYITYSDVTYLVDTGFEASDWATDSAAYLTSQGGDYNILLVEYIWNNTTISTWSPKLEDAIAQRLAIKVATGITNDPKTKTNLLNEFESLTMPKARSVDGKEGRMRSIFRSQWWRSSQRTYRR
jgi:hypothetical protein